MITEQEIEDFAETIAADPYFDAAHKRDEASIWWRNIDALVGHLEPREFDAVLSRASKLARQTGKAVYADADAMESVIGFARATGMPTGCRPIPWLLDHWLIEDQKDGWRFTPRSVT